MKRLVAILSVVLLYAGADAQSVQDPNVEVREAKGFHAVSVSDAFDVFLTQSPTEEKVAVSASETKYLQYIKVEVKNGVLEISWDSKGKWHKGNKKLTAYVSFKKLDKLKASGACDIKVAGVIKTDDLLVELSGASDMKAKVDVRKLTFDMSGASDASISGKATHVDIDVSGACSFEGFDLATDYCNVSASGHSDIEITVNKELSAIASGASDIDYKGSAVIRDVKTSGASSVSRS